MRVFEVTAASALVRSRIADVGNVINPYTGCEHGCRYCYAAFMKKYSKHNRNTRWGDFVEVKANVADVLARELPRKRKPGRAMLSSVCDPYQPVEERYELTRECLRLLLEHGWGVDILTRSALVQRDIELLSTALDVTVGLSIGTDDDGIRQVVEPHAPAIAARVEALRKLHAAGVVTWVFIAPMLPMSPEHLHELIGPHVSYVMVDKLNYAGKVKTLFKRHGWDGFLQPDYAQRTNAVLKKMFGAKYRELRG